MNLSWGAATDNVGVTGYEILRDGHAIATVGAVTSYADTTVSPLTHYDYYVKAIDAAGNRSVAEQHGGCRHAGAARQHDGDVQRGRGRASSRRALRTRTSAPSTKLRATNASPKFETYFKFDLAGITGTVQSAKLHVWDWNDATNNGPAVYQAGNSWTETGITWNNRPARIGVPSDNKVAIPVETWVEYDVVPFVLGNGELTLVWSETPRTVRTSPRRSTTTRARRPSWR